MYNMTACIHDKNNALNVLHSNSAVTFCTQTFTLSKWAYYSLEHRTQRIVWKIIEMTYIIIQSEKNVIRRTIALQGGWIQGHDG